MMAWIGRRPRLAVRTMIRAVKVANDEQVRMWESVLLTSRAVPATVTGPLRWVPSLDGDRLAGSYLPTWDQSETGLHLRQRRCAIGIAGLRGESPRSARVFFRSRRLNGGQAAVHLAGHCEHPARVRRAGRAEPGCAGRRGTSFGRVMSWPLAAGIIGLREREGEYR